MREKEIIKFINNPKNNIKFIKIIFPDVLGREMNFTIPSEELESVFSQGKGFDGSSVEGFVRTEESDLIIVPDPDTFRVLPWQYELENLTWKEAIIFGDIFTPEGKHFKEDSRYILKEILKKTKKFGKLFVGPELEFFIFANSQNPQTLDSGGYFYGGRWGEIRKAVQIYLKETGILTDYDHHEVAPSQHEIDLKFSDALSVADSIVLAKYIIKRTTRKTGFYASFMPKPLPEFNGSGMHLHLSLWKERKNLFFKNNEDFISDLAKGYIMGLIKYGKEIQLGLNQWVNSYKRLMPGFEAPVYLAWGKRNRSSYIRVPDYQPGKEKSTRIEIRSPDPTCNIYLCLALIQSAGISGIKENLKFISPEEKDIFKMKKSEFNKKNIKMLSGNLNKALECFKQSKLSKQTLGKDLFQKIIQNKEKEWKDYRKRANKKYDKKVTQYEIERYLPVL